MLEYNGARLVKDAIQCNRRPAAGEKPCQVRLSLLDRPIPEIAAVAFEEIEREVIACDGNGRGMTTRRFSAPSMTQERTGSALIAAVTTGMRHAQSRPRREMSRTRSPLRSATMR